VFSFAVIDAAGDTTYLLNRQDVSFIREAYPSSSTSGDFLKYYAQFDGDYGQQTKVTLFLHQLQTLTTTIELHYYYDPESIVTCWYILVW
jgi:hypothetical protein